MKALIPSEIIEKKILLIRGEKVMLDADLAELYEVETKMLVRAVKRNIDRFPSDFMIQLDKEEFENLRFQFGTSSRWGGRRYLPYAFTEQGVAMLSSVLNAAARSNTKAAAQSAIAAALPSAHRQTLNIKNLEGLNNRSALRV